MHKNNSKSTVYWQHRNTYGFRTIQHLRTTTLENETEEHHLRMQYSSTRKEISTPEKCIDKLLDKAKLLSTLNTY